MVLFGGLLDQQQTQTASSSGQFDPCQATHLLRKEMGLLDVVLFNIAAVLGPRREVGTAATPA